jgi:hypothetical protein
MDNTNMEFHGRVQNGVVVLEGSPALPDGTEVTVSCDKVRIRRKPGKKKRVELPLIDSKHPGTLHLTNDRIAELLEEEEIASFQKSLRKARR